MDGTSRVRTRELFEYVSISAGMALACGGYAMLGRLYFAAGPRGLVISLCVAAVLCLLMASAIGELAGRFPSAPGIRTYLRAGLGDAPSVGFTILLLLMVILFAGVEGLTLGRAVQTVAPGLPPEIPGAAAILLAIGLNLFGIELPWRAQVVMTLLLLVAFAIVIGAALLTDVPAAPAPAGTRAPAFPPLGALVLAQTTLGAVFVFSGFEWVAPLGRNPSAYKRLIPSSMLAGVVVLTLVFVGSALALGRAGLSPAMAATPHIGLGTAVLPGVGGPLMVAAYVLSALTTINAGLLSAGRLTYALARERVLPPSMARISSGGVPFVAVLSVGGLALLAAGAEWTLTSAEAVGTTCAAIDCLVYAAYLGAAARAGRAPGDATATAAPRWVRGRLFTAAKVAGALAFLGLSLAVLGESSGVGGASGRILAASLIIAAAAALLHARGGSRPPGARPIGRTVLAGEKHG